MLRDPEGPLNSAFLNISIHFTAHLFSPWVLNSTRCQHFLASLGAFCLFELRVFQTFPDILQPICSGHGCPA